MIKVFVSIITVSHTDFRFFVRFSVENKCVRQIVETNCVRNTKKVSLHMNSSKLTSPRSVHQITTQNAQIFLV